MKTVLMVVAMTLLGAGAAYAGPPPAVPEPGTLMLLGSGVAGLAGLGLYRRLRK